MAIDAVGCRYCPQEMMARECLKLQLYCKKGGVGVGE
jgi:hypothetical protein